jgi:hypothetical protein
LKRLIAILALVLIAAWWFWPRENEPTDAVSPAMDARKNHPREREEVSPETPDAGLTLVPASAESERLLDPQASARDDVEVMTVLVGEYRRLLGGNPVGDNDEITAALAGKNPKRLALVSPAVTKRVAPQGQLLDRWGMPYFFHARSGTSMEIISAGPDGMLHTADDLQGGDPE